jgi:hypothetical protein
MTEHAFSEFLSENSNIEYGHDDEHYYFRNTSLPWYANNPGNCTRITREILEKLSPEELLSEINRGLEVECITRITGYYTKTAQWNKGKIGELKDRTRYPI